MKEYIERKTLINIFCEDCDRHSDENPFACSMCEDIKEIMKLPAADVEPVRHGRWFDMDSFDAHYQPIYQCSECRKQVADNYISCHKFCLHCGAKMDKEN